MTCFFFYEIIVCLENLNLVKIELNHVVNSHNTKNNFTIKFNLWD